MSPVSESSPHSLQNYVCFFLLTSRPRICPQTNSLQLPLEWSQVTHIPASIKSGGAYKPKKSVFYSTFARHCVMIPIFQDGSLPLQYTHKNSSPLRQPLHAQIANHHIQWAGKIFLVCVFLFVYCFYFVLFFKCLRIFQSSAQSHESAARQLQRAAGHIKGTCLLIDSGYCHGKE